MAIGAVAVEWPILLSSPWSILRTSITSRVSAAASSSEMASISRATIRWYSSSHPELSAILRKRANCFSLSWRRPSTIFVGIDMAARIIWARSATSGERRIRVATRCACSASAWAFRQTSNFLKSLTPNAGAEDYHTAHHFGAPLTAAPLTAPCFGISHAGEPRIQPRLVSWSASTAKGPVEISELVGIHNTEAGSRKLGSSLAGTFHTGGRSMCFSRPYRQKKGSEL